jgi:hypothetical protein
MVDPVLRGVRDEGKVTYVIFVDFVIELKENTEASARKNGMCRFGENVIV